MAKKQLIMENSILLFDDILFEGEIMTKNFSRINLIKIPDEWHDTGKYKEFRVQDDEKIETLSLKLYDNTNYWDFIFVYNGITNFFGLPVNYDIVLERANAVYDRWYDRFGVQKNITGVNDITLEEKKAEILEKEVQKNELFRDIKYIKPELMGEFLKEMDKLKEDL